AGQPGCGGGGGGSHGPQRNVDLAPGQGRIDAGCREQAVEIDVLDCVEIHYGDVLHTCLNETDGQVRSDRADANYQDAEPGQADLDGLAPGRDGSDLRRGGWWGGTKRVVPAHPQCAAHDADVFGIVVAAVVVPESG